MTASVGTASGSHAVRLQPGLPLGEYRLGPPLWPLRIADAYRAEGPRGPATIYVVHARIAAHPGVREAVVAGTRAAAALGEHRHLVHTLAAGLTGDILWIATEEVDGSLVRDLLAKKRQANTTGLGTRATGNLITGVAAALADVHHGALADESIVVNRTGRVRVIDLALGPGTAAAMVAGLIPAQSSLAPEVLAGGPPSGPADVYAIGALLYQALVGAPLERGGPRPSDVVHGVNTQIDEVVARACHRDPDRRFGRAEVLGEVVAEALTKGGAIHTSVMPAVQSAPTLTQQVSLATELAASASGSLSGADRVLAAALADSTEKWLISKGRLDYGPFSLADVVAQIERHEIVAGNVIMDKDTGARVEISEHTLLGPLVETARQQRDDQRRAAAEVAVQTREKKRGVLLYGMIGAAVLGLAALVALVIVPALAGDSERKLRAVSAIEGASLKVTVSEPKKPPARRSPGVRRTASGGAGPGLPGGNTEDTMTLDLSDESDEGDDALSMDVVFGVYSRYGGQLGGCLASTGESHANIYISINGPSGRVQTARINGKQSGALYGCLNRVLRGMKFPSIKGPRTRAEFDIASK